MNSQFSLLTTRRFLPLFIVQFIGAFIDNLLKSMVAVMVAYGLWETHGVNPAVLVSLAAALFILPFALFCPFAGALSDKYDKALLIRRIKLVEIFIVLAGVFALFSGSLIFALLVLFALGVQSAFFSPNKFSILPQLLSGEELVAGNGLVSTGTYLAILAGTILGSVLALMPGGIEIASSVLIVLALVGYGAARRISCAPPDAASAAMTLRWNVFAQAWGVLKFAFTQTSGVRAAILGTAWFYFVASTFHAQFPNFTKQTLGADNYVLTFFMVVFSLGISVGGLLNHSLLKLRAIGYFIPAACICMGIFGIDLYFAAGSYHAPQGLQTLGQFLGRAQGWR
jgi:acyl-[acyl-carrier-protein]-phospholipid O-acyltransferase/long-chain-fatty-acid--[acyl-carrier-protein] ligase